ncbi:hypothetical protein [Spiroplasma citri]|uniref:Uncharacterized protein n=1 Tax=Spiroplasma citri TaxID=2133 RepID=A0AAJ4EJS8_SPICI|nr:hypothetical protein [Spiroplasma citri]QIA67129.1 hypothetical protein GMI18_05415 [Spiroplasma citri]QIA69036.1 hypothetical protein GL298_05655 [Spiroplasma citri]QIA70903.1 hypothetical protein GL981_05715 [Spiroplasma citri]QIA72007.1 hypothetical protein GL981_11980 [Spiroplasma citri]QIA72904.1 hypothetical protein GL982_04290 [Spiroplasma citri]
MPKLNNYACQNCKTKFGNIMGDGDKEMEKIFINNLVCSKCDLCYHCCKNMHNY